MITNEQIKDCINNASEKGYSIKVRDIAFVLLTREIEDYSVCYKSIFGNDNEFNEEYLKSYIETDAIVYLDTYFKRLEYKEKKNNGMADISFDENKAYMLEIKRQTEQAMQNNEIEKKDGLKILADISVKLNDKFNVADTTKEQTIIVNNKFSDICSYCGHETPMPSKERCMKVYNLIEKES